MKKNKQSKKKQQKTKDGSTVANQKLYCYNLQKIITFASFKTKKQKSKIGELDNKYLKPTVFMFFPMLQESFNIHIPTINSFS